eukprot:CAMPEP_0175708822 /NCGR_PEP_ID=MMETSP0097-20121207/39261_1 /TAXON_ID=311494 /ORGANISM="Alexandrium monilatum, Strain CCMP3105" /LENGTH=337 /DNA_ID=CAMNT_0017016215 /DNA_START=51 /DNA_END=1064 /DNA_ORIENTATION=-
MLNGVEVSGEFAQQALRMPPLVRRLLLGGGDAAVEDMDAEVLLAELRLREQTLQSARTGLASHAADAILRQPAALGPQACAALREHVDAERQTRCDTVDGAPDHQLNLTPQRLEVLIGANAAVGLWKLVSTFAGEAGVADAMPVEIFVRRYTADSRPWNPFHVDSAAVTVNVALCEDGSFEGGRLLACFDGAVRTVSRAEGEATVHASTLLHGVSMMTSGVRYSLIMFFGRAPEEHPALNAREQAAEAEAAAGLMSHGEFLRSSRRLLGEPGFSAMEANYRRLQDGADVGRAVERVVSRYGAPHLRPTCVYESFQRGKEAVCWSMYNMLNYAAMEAT